MTATAVYSNEELLRPETNYTQSSKTDADNFEAYLPLLKDKKNGVITNQTCIVLIQDKSNDLCSKKEQKHLVDFLLEKNTAIQTIFAPEHGFRGTATTNRLRSIGN